MQKKNNYAVMIISHKRANEQLTYEALKENNYTGPIYILVDDEDPQLEEYKENYGDIIKVFNKEEMIGKFDAIDNFRNKTNCLLPSAYCKELAKELKLDYYIRMDDDIQSIKERYNDNGSLRGRKIKNMNKIIELFIKYMQDADLSCLSFGNEGSYFGGVNGKYSNGMGKNNNQTFIMRTNDDISFVGTRNEDINMVVKYSPIGKKIYEVYRIAVSSPQQGSNSGGLSEDYKNAGMYVYNFYSIILAPSSLKIQIKADKIMLKKDFNKIAPKVINEVYKK